MDEYTAGAFANRDEPIPLFTVTASDGDQGSVSEPDRTSKRDRFKQSASRMKAIAQDLGAEHAQRLQNNGTASLQDRLFAKYVRTPACASLRSLRGKQTPAASHTAGGYRQWRRGTHRPSVF
jgi:hypothetical protein